MKGMENSEMNPEADQLHTFRLAAVSRSQIPKEIKVDQANIAAFFRGVRQATSTKAPIMPPICQKY